MKKIVSLFSMMLLAVLLLNSSPQKAEASTWEYVGNAGFTAGSTIHTNIAFNPISNEPYIVFNNSSQKAQVMKFNGTSWVNVGIAGFSRGSVNSTSIAFNPSTNEPYVAFWDLFDIPGATVMKFDGTSWVNVGMAGFSTAYAPGISLAFNPSTNEPYVAYKNRLTTADTGKATVMRFDGTSWVNVGVTDVSDNDVNSTNISFNPSTNEPYLTYGESQGISMKKFNGTSWVTVGSPMPDTSSASMAFNASTSEPYIAYTEYNPAEDNFKATVKKFNGTSWLAIGVERFTMGTAQSLSFAFNPSTNEPYLSYRDTANSYKATVMKFDGTSWVNVGASGFTRGSVNYTSIAFNPSTNEPYLAFYDGANSGKATVMKFDPNKVDIPTVSIPEGEYLASQSVILSTATAGADIYYTTDNTTPTSASTPYTEAITISQNTTLKAIAIKSGMPNSNIMSESYTIKVIMPEASPTGGVYNSIQSVTLSTTTADANIYYTTNYSTPNALSTHYTTPIIVSSDQTIKAIAIKPGLTDSEIMDITFNINLPRASTPTASPIGGTYNSPQSVALSTTTDGTDIYYTTNGDTPTASSTHYTGAISVSSSETIKAIAIKSGMIDSYIASINYVIKASAPTASPVDGTYNSSQSVTLSTTTDGADIYYTTNGDTPTISSTHYTGAITVSTSQTLKAIAVKSGMGNSDVMNETYTITLPTSTFRFRNLTDGQYLLTSSLTEKNSILANYVGIWTLESSAFDVFTTHQAGTFAVSRFRNMINGKYLYTISDAEKLSIQQNYASTWIQEDDAFFAYATQQPSTLPVYRFRNLVDGRYLLTGSDVERDSILHNYADTWTQEDNAFYIPQ